MTEPNKIRERSEEIHLLIASDSIPQAIKLLLDYVRDFSDDKSDVNEVIVISSGYHRLEKAERRGVLAFEEVELKRNQILYQILGLIDSIENGIAFKLAS